MEKTIDQKLAITLRQNRVSFAAIFGSRAKGLAKTDSDFDILIDTDPKDNFSLLDQVKLKEDLELVLNRKVDLVTLGGLNRFMRDEVIKTMKVIYDERKR